MRSCRLATCTCSGLFCCGCLHLFLQVTPGQMQMCKAFCHVFTQNRSGRTKALHLCVLFWCVRYTKKMQLRCT